MITVYTEAVVVVVLAVAVVSGHAMQLHVQVRMIYLHVLHDIRNVPTILVTSIN